MSAKYDLSHATFNGPVTVGDNHKLLIEKFGTYLDKKAIIHCRSEELKILIRDTQIAISEDVEIESSRKAEATNMLAQITDEVSTGTSADPKGLTQYWSKFINLVRDSSTVISFARDLAQILGLPVP